MPTRRSHYERSPVGPVSLRNERIETGIASRPRVFILSDVRLYCEGVSLSLARTNEVEVVGAGPPNAFAQIAELQTDVVVADASLVGCLSLIVKLRELVPRTRVVAFAVSGTDQDVIACAEAGISSYVSREGSTEDLIKAILQSMRGELVVSPRLTALLFEHVAALSAGRTQSIGKGPLTQRENEIIPLVEQGLSNKEIARQLRIGTGTIKHHIHNILEKLQVRRRGEIAARARRDARPIQPAAGQWRLPEDRAV